MASVGGATNWTDGPLLPWTPTWRIPVCATGAVVAGFLGVGLAVSTSKSAVQRFGIFYRGDISAYLAERWKISTTVMPVMALLIFLCLLFRHPLRSPSGVWNQWNAVAVGLAATASVAVAGLGLVTQNDNTKTSRYPFQHDVVHGSCMFLGFGLFFCYQILHSACLVRDLLCGAPPEAPAAQLLLAALALAELLLVLSGMLHFALWLVETSREEYPDDPRCNKRGEWVSCTCGLAFLLTIPVLTQCVPSSHPAVQAIGYAVVVPLVCVATAALTLPLLLPQPKSCRSHQCSAESPACSLLGG